MVLLNGKNGIHFRCLFRSAERYVQMCYYLHCFKCNLCGVKEIALQQFFFYKNEKEQVKLISAIRYDEYKLKWKCNLLNVGFFFIVYSHTQNICRVFVGTTNIVEFAERVGYPTDFLLKRVMQSCAACLPTAFVPHQAKPNEIEN